MHDVPGAEEMMETCGAMMDAMSGMMDMREKDGRDEGDDGREVGRFV